MNRNRVVDIVNWLHRLYLGLLPSLATFVLLRRYGYRWPFLLFVGGVALTGVYLAVTYYLTPLPDSVPRSLWVWLDGPLFAVVAQGVGSIDLVFFIEGFFIDALALWLAILLLALLSSRPTSGQRTRSLGISVGVLGVVFSLFWPYVTETLWRDRLRMVWLLVGIVEGVVARYLLLQTEKTVQTDEEKGILYIALLLLLWVGALSAGLMLHAGNRLGL